MSNSASLNPKLPISCICYFFICSKPAASALLPLLSILNPCLFESEPCIHSEPQACVGPVCAAPLDSIYIPLQSPSPAPDTFCVLLHSPSPQHFDVVCVPCSSLQRWAALCFETCNFCRRSPFHGKHQKEVGKQAIRGNSKAATRTSLL